MALDALDQFLPIASGQSGFFKAQNDLLNNLGGNVGYEVRDGYVIMTEDITATKGITHVDMQLVVADMEKYGDFDILPIPADLAAKVITDCARLFASQAPQNETADSVSEKLKQ